MSKELEALENIKGLWVEVLNDQDKLVKETVGDLPSTKIIEKALKDYYALKKEHEELINELSVALNLNECQSVKEWVALMQKKLKALDIIKAKDLDLTYLLSCLKQKDYEYSDYLVGYDDDFDLLTEEEFNLIKGVL